jgi:L-lactate dehydrogenase complex protein LldG
MERDRFLARVRRAVNAAALPQAATEDPGLLLPDLPAVDLLEQFTAALEAVDGRVHRNDPVLEVERIMNEAGTQSYLSWHPHHLGVPGLVERLETAGFRRIEEEVPDDAEGRMAHQSGYLPLVVGITGAEAGFAESGTLVLRSGPGRPRMASLIPSVHIALLSADRIYRSLSHWAASEAATVADAANVVFVTGPIRTGDIEMQLTLGVHGPKRLHVVLL